MTDYARRTAAAARLTAARQDEARHQRAENRRAYGPSTGGPALTRDRQAAAFPGFPPLRWTYDTPEAVTRWGPSWVSYLNLAKVRDLAASA